MHHIIFCLDNNYLKILPSVLKSFNKTNNIKNFTLNFVISDSKKKLHQNILDIAKNISSDFIIRYKYYLPTEEFKQILIEYSNLLFGDKEHIKKQRVYFNYANWSRFHIVDLFSDIKKGLYLDLDILFNKNIEDIFKIDIDNYMVAVSPYTKGNKSIITKIRSLDKPSDILNVNKFFDHFKINREDLNNKHYNCGVMLFNFELLKKNNIKNKVEDLLKYMIKYPYIKMSGTQNVQNILIPNYNIFPSSYNYLQKKNTTNQHIIHFKGIKVLDLLDNPLYINSLKSILK